MTIPSFLEGQGGAVHFMGVAGAGMISLAELFARNGLAVTGCDLQPDPAARALSSWGCRIFSGHDPAHVDDVSAVIVTAAVPNDHPEILRAREKGIPVMKRAEALGEWVNRGTVVAVAGTHGKTTTTAMATEALSSAGLDPTAFVGGRVLDWGSNLRFGGDELFVVEADEYDRSFHHLRPTVAVLNNLEADHLDTYEDLEGVREAFRIFLERTQEDGQVVACGDDHGVSSLLAGTERPTRTYGLNPGSQLRGIELRQSGTGVAFQVLETGEPVGEVTLRVPGRHNVLNALGAAAAARSLGAEWGEIKAGLASFKGVGRRFQVLGEVDGVTVVDDYAHHPSEIHATLAAARNQFPGRRLVAVFQPHLFSRTRDFSDALGEALARADVVWVTDVYPAREAPIEGVTGVLVAQGALASGAPNVSFHAALEELAEEMVPTLEAGDVCLTMGAGSIEFFGSDLLEALENRYAEKGGLA